MRLLDRLNTREKTLLFAIMALLFIWIIYSLIIEPLHNRWTRLNKNAEIAKVELKKAVKILQQREYADSEYNKHLNKFTTKGSDEEEMALILNEIEAVARQSSVRIVNMKPRRVEKDDFYRLFYVDLDTEATMRNVLIFIKRLKDSRFCLCVEQITLNSRTSDPSILNGVITISRFGLTPEE